MMKSLSSVELSDEMIAYKEGLAMQRNTRNVPQHLLKVAFEIHRHFTRDERDEPNEAFTQEDLIAKSEWVYENTTEDTLAEAILELEDRRMLEKVLDENDVATRRGPYYLWRIDNEWLERKNIYQAMDGEN